MVMVIRQADHNGDGDADHNGEMNSPLSSPRAWRRSVLPVGRHGDGVFPVIALRSLVFLRRLRTAGV